MGGYAFCYSWHTADNGIGRNILCHNRPCADDGTVADGHAGKDHRLKADPHLVPHSNIALVIPCLIDLHAVLPLIVEDRKRVCGKRAHRMVGTVEQKFCSAGNRTELPDLQSVMVDRVVIQDIVFFKIPRVVYKIIVEREITNLNIRVCDNVLQIHNRIIPYAGKYFSAIRNRHCFILLF